MKVNKLISKMKKVIKVDLNLTIKILIIVVLLLIILAISLFLLKDRSLEEKAPSINLQTKEEAVFTSTPTPKTTPKATYKPKAKSETEEILEAAKRYVQSHTTQGQRFRLELTNKVKKQRDEYALVQVNPVPAGSAEGAGVVLQKIGGLWIVMDFGTLLMEWHERVPELFNFL